MSLEKAIEHKKERRKQYRGAKAVDTWCRNHGNCIYCEENRLYKSNKLNQETKSKINEYKAGDN